MTPQQKEQVLYALRHGLGAGYAAGQAAAKSAEERDQNRELWQTAARILVAALRKEGET